MVVIQKDLFGSENDLPEKKLLKKKRTQANGYAARPGTGPDGEKCKTCNHHVIRRMSKRYHKCGLVIANNYHTHGVGTDIRVNSPACTNWEEKES